MVSHPDVGLGVADAARLMTQQQTLEETLQSIAEVARRSVPVFGHVGIARVDTNGEVRTLAAAGKLTRPLDRLQYALAEGPYMESLREGCMIWAPRLRHEQRWPLYAPEAARAGVRSQLGVNLHLDGHGSLGCINFYSTVSEHMDLESEQLVDLLATHAARALARDREPEVFAEALQSSTVVGQAMGILMERHSLDEDGAFAFLLRSAAHAKLRFRDVAEGLVEQLHSRLEVDVVKHPG